MTWWVVDVNLRLESVLSFRFGARQQSMQMSISTLCDTTRQVHKEKREKDGQDDMDSKEQKRKTHKKTQTKAILQTVVICYGSYVCNYWD